MRFIETRRGRLAASLVATAALAVALAPAALAGGGGATIVRGTQHEAGSCDGGNPSAYLMTGDLEGCWIIDEFATKHTAARGTMLAYGTEHFTGWLGSRFGTFWTTFTYTARFDGATELHGRCHHPIVRGDGDFAGARGELNFTDVVSVDPPYYPYWGNIQLGRGTGVTIVLASTTATLASATLASTAKVSAPC